MDLDPPPQSDSHSQYDQAMTDHDDSTHATITQSSLDYHNHPFVQSTGHDRPMTSYSDTGFTRSYQSNSEMNSPQLNSNPLAESTQTTHSQQTSRPGSQMSGHYAQSQSGQYQSSSGREDQSQGGKRPSVVIKVGMVGDAQIGKTSLMVKYVEGSWDEDYIQTLGTA